jgi:hypothetical protein
MRRFLVGCEKVILYKERSDTRRRLLKRGHKVGRVF